MRSSKTLIFTVTTDLISDQRMQRICNSLHTAGYKVLLIGRFLGTPASFQFESRQLKCWMNRGFGFYAEFNLRLFLFLLFRSMDCICSVDLDTILAGKFLKRFKSTKHVYDAHEYFSQSPELINKKRIQNFWERIAIRTIPKVDLAYTVNESLANLMSERYKQSFQVIRNLPNLKSNDHTGKKKKWMLYQGVLNKGRGLEQMIEMMKSFPDWKLKIAGRGDLEEVIKSLVYKNKQENQIEFLGHLSPNALSQLTQECSLGFNLLEDESQNYYFSLANKFFDYMMAGIPSVSMNFPEYKRFEQEYNCWLLIDDLTIENLIKKVSELIGDPFKMKTYSENAKTASKVLNWEKEELKLIELFDNLLIP